MAKSSTNDPDYVSVSEAERMMGVGKRTVYRLIDIGALTACRPHKHLRIKVSSIQDWIDKTTLQPGDLSLEYKVVRESLHGGRGPKSSGM